MEKYLSKDQVKAIIEGAPKGYTPGKVVDGLVARGYILEGFNEPKPTVMDTVKDYATQAVTNPLETAKGVVKGIPGNATQLTKLVEMPGKAITGAIADVTGTQAPQGLDYSAVEELTAPSNKAQQVGYVASGVLPVERAVGGVELAAKGISGGLGLAKTGVLKAGAEVFFGGGKDLLKYGVKKGSETALDAVSKFSKTGDSLAIKVVDFISADPEKKVATLLKESTPQELDWFLSTAEKASTDPRLPTPYEVTGKKLNETLPLLQKKLRSIGQAKADIISATREGLSSFSEQTKPLISKLTSLKNSFSEIDKANTGVVDSIIADAKTVSTKLDADKFVDKVQDALYSGNRTMSIPQGSSLDKQLRGIIGEYNGALKSSLPSEYSALNEEYSKMIENISLINRALGETVDGVPLQGASLIKQFFSPSGTKAKEIFDFVKKETNGQVDLAKDATLSKFAMELFDDPRAKSLLQGIPDVPTTISGVVSKVAEKVGGDKLQSVLRESTIKKAKKLLL